jgi:hypothetical protein
MSLIIYNTLPHNLDRLLGRHPPKCPVAFIGGRQSEEMKQVGMQMTQQVTKGRIMMIDGSHLFPMEKPVATAAAIEAALRGFDFRFEPQSCHPHCCSAALGASSYSQLRPVSQARPP